MSTQTIKIILNSAINIIDAIEERQMIIDFAKYDSRPFLEAEIEKDQLINKFYDKLTMLSADTEKEFLTKKYIK